MDWQPLTLWRANSLAAETDAVKRRLSEAIAHGDHDATVRLRRSIEARIDSLQDFYLQNLEDDRAALFLNQRTALRELLRNVDSGNQLTRSTQSSPDKSKTPTKKSQALTNRAVHQYKDDARLTRDELSSWTQQIGRNTMKLINDELFDAVYTELSRSSIDERLSIRELRSWYLSFGRNGATLDNLFPVSKRHAMKAQSKSKRKESLQSDKPNTNNTLLPWEIASPQTFENLDVTGAKSLADLGIKDNVIDFVVELSASEYRDLQLKKRRHAAEAKYMQRARKAAISSGRLSRGDTSTDSMSAPYMGTLQSNSALYRQEKPDQWLTSSGWQKQI